MRQENENENDSKFQKDDWGDSGQWRAFKVTEREIDDRVPSKSKEDRRNRKQQRQGTPIRRANGQEQKRQRYVRNK